MGTFEAILWVILIFGVMEVIGMFFRTSKNESKPPKDKDAIYEKAPNKIKCRYLECNQVVMIPKQYLDLSYRGPQTAKCPNCDWKMRKVKIIQEWGLD